MSAKKLSMEERLMAKFREQGSKGSEAHMQLMNIKKADTEVAQPVGDNVEESKKASEPIAEQTQEPAHEPVERTQLPVQEPIDVAPDQNQREVAVNDVSVDDKPSSSDNQDRGSNVPNKEPSQTKNASRRSIKTNNKPSDKPIVKEDFKDDVEKDVRNVEPEDTGFVWRSEKVAPKKQRSFYLDMSIWESMQVILQWGDKSSFVNDALKRFILNDERSYNALKQKNPQLLEKIKNLKT